MPDTEDTEVQGMPISRSAMLRERDADTKREGMPIQRERGCQYRERGDADVKECDTKGAGMRIPRESDADTECYQVTKPGTQQQSGRLANGCERQVRKLFQDESAVGRTSNLL
jgi:hypothetical protein